MKIRIKSNYLTRYVLQDYGNMEPLLTFTPFVLVCILFILFPSHSHPLSTLYFFPLLSVVLLLSVFSVWKLRWFARMGNLWACFHMLFRINSDFGSLDSRTFHFHAAFDFHSTFITFSENTHRWGCEQDIKRKCARERERQRETFLCAHLLLKQMIAIRMPYGAFLPHSIHNGFAKSKRKWKCYICMIYMGMSKQFRINCSSLTQFINVYAVCCFRFFHYHDNDLVIRWKCAQTQKGVKRSKEIRLDVLCLTRH